MSVEGVRLSVDGFEGLGLARFDAEGAYGGWDLVFLAAASEAFQEIEGGFAILGPPGEERRKETAARLVDMAMARAPLMESMSMTVVLTDFFLRDPDSLDEVSFDALNLAMTMEGLDTDAASLVVEYAHDGLAIPASGLDAGLAPHAFDLRLALRDLPSRDLAVLGVDMVRNDLIPFEAGISQCLPCSTCCRQAACSRSSAWASKAPRCRRTFPEGSPHPVSRP